MKQDDHRSVMTSAVRRLGQEISKLGLRMRTRSPSGSDSGVFCSTDELAAKGSMDGQAGKTLSAEDTFVNDGATGSCDAAQPTKQRRHSRNELDEDVECQERRSSIKAALRPTLSRKSRSDLAKYSRPNQDFNLKQGTLRRNGSENSIKESIKENHVTGGIRVDENGKGEGKKDPETSTYRVATKSQEHVDKTTKPRRPRRLKRSKSFSGLLSRRHGGKKALAHKETTGNDGCKTVLRKSNSLRSLSDKVENSQSDVVENSIAITFQMQTDITETHRNNMAKLSPQIFVTAANGDECANGITRSTGTRLSYMALEGFRYEQGLIETDLCSTEL
ncbi:hypothetical protein OS493_008493 [Desmophyllum pertusum]|uniref:Uncharacterized protein n=1 Tax=Desmophyllum pertusum TaxID=174260 RepID=A0A9X0D4A9_9CNID|nr:hypothetical protein OS493_008493 [Desmophyllum pertusum]